MKREDFLFEEIKDEEMFAEYSEGCSGERSDCCTRECDRATTAEWGKFLEVNAGIVQY